MIDNNEVPFINGERKDKLTSTRDFSASVVSEILSLTSDLPFELYQDLSRVRKARNDWIHQLDPVGMETAKLSITVAESMLAVVEGINLHISLYATVHGGS